MWNVCRLLNFGNTVFCIFTIMLNDCRGTKKDLTKSVCFFSTLINCCICINILLRHCLSLNASYLQLSFKLFMYFFPMKNSYGFYFLIAWVMHLMCVFLFILPSWKLRDKHILYAVYFFLVFIYLFFYSPVAFIYFLPKYIYIYILLLFLNFILFLNFT